MVFSWLMFGMENWNLTGALSGMVFYIFYAIFFHVFWTCIREGYSVFDKNKNLVCKLEKSLHGLKQFSRQWYKKLESFEYHRIWERRFRSLLPAIWRGCDISVILIMYVDDMLIASSNMKEIKLMKSQLSEIWHEWLEAKQILRMKISRSVGCIYWRY